MALSEELLKSFASITNDSLTGSDATISYGHAIVHNNNSYVIMDSALSANRINSLLTNGDFIVDYIGYGEPIITVASNGTTVYVDSKNTPLPFITAAGGDLYLDKNTNDLYISEKSLYATLVNGQAINKTELVWNKCCTITSAIPTVTVKNGDRVIITIKNHKVLITGNISRPSGSGGSSGSVNLTWETDDIDFSTYV